MQHVGTYSFFFDSDEEPPSPPNPKQIKILDAQYTLFREVAIALCYGLPKAQERKAKAWIRKIDDLKKKNRYHLRDAYIKLLILCLQRQKLVGTFSYYPHDDIDMPQLDLDVNIQQHAKEMFEANEEKGDGPPVQADLSTDLTTYAAVQEIPGYGVHCFFAISNMEPISKWLNNEKPFVPIPLSALGIKDEAFSKRDKSWNFEFKTEPERPIHETEDGDRMSIDEIERILYDSSITAEDVAKVEEWLKEAEKVAAEVLQQSQKVPAPVTQFTDEEIAAIKELVGEEFTLSFGSYNPSNLGADENYMMTDEEFAAIEERFRELNRRAENAEFTEILQSPFSRLSPNQQELPVVSTPLPMHSQAKSFNYGQFQSPESDFSGESVYSAEWLRPKDKEPRQHVKRNIHSDLSALSPQDPTIHEFEEHSSLYERIIDHTHFEQSSDEETAEEREMLFKPFKLVIPDEEIPEEMDNFYRFKPVHPSLSPERISESPDRKISSSPMKPQKFSPEQMQSLIRSHVKLSPAKEIRAHDGDDYKSTQYSPVRDFDGEVDFSSSSQYPDKDPQDVWNYQAASYYDFSMMPKQDPVAYGFIECTDMKDVEVESYKPEKFFSRLKIFEEEFRRAARDSLPRIERDQEVQDRRLTYSKSSVSINIEKQSDSDLGKHTSKLSITKTVTENKKGPSAEATDLNLEEGHTPTALSTQNRIMPHSSPKEYDSPKTPSIREHIARFRRFISMREENIEDESNQFPTPEVMRAGTPGGEQPVNPIAYHALSPISPLQPPPSPQEAPFSPLMQCDVDYEPQLSPVELEQSVMDPARFLSFSECLPSPRAKKSVELGMESPIASRMSPHLVSTPQASPKMPVSPRVFDTRSRPQRLIHGSPYMNAASPKSPGFSPISGGGTQSFQARDLSPTMPCEAPIHSTFLSITQMENVANIALVPYKQNVVQKNQTFDIISEYSNKRPAALDHTFVAGDPQISQRMLQEIPPSIDRTFDVYFPGLECTHVAPPPALDHTYGVPPPALDRTYGVPPPALDRTYVAPPSALDHTYGVLSPPLNRTYGASPSALDGTYVAPPSALDHTYGVPSPPLNRTYGASPSALDHTYGVPPPPPLNCTYETCPLNQFRN